MRRVAAAEGFRWLCDELGKRKAHSHLASAAGNLSEALIVSLARRGVPLDAGRRNRSAPDDLDALILWMPVRAKTLARRGAFDEALAPGDRGCRARRARRTD